LVKTVVDENVHKNLNELMNALQQTETEVKNAQNDTTAESNDRFLPAMMISFPVLDNCFCCHFRVLSDGRIVSRVTPGCAEFPQKLKD